MKKKKALSQDAFGLIEGKLPSFKKETYDWEKKKFGFEPWHLTTIVLIIDVCILLMYFFINAFVALQLPIGYGALIVNVLCIIGSFIVLYQKRWPLGTVRFSKMLNVVAICITSVVFVITLMIDSMA